jgi:hypothetical protein
MSVVLSTLSIAGVWNMYRFRLSLYADRLEYHSGFGVTLLRRAESGGDTRCLLVHAGAPQIRWWTLKESCSD